MCQETLARLGLCDAGQPLPIATLVVLLVANASVSLLVGIPEYCADMMPPTLSSKQVLLW